MYVHIHIHIFVFFTCSPNHFLLPPPPHLPLQVHYNSETCQIKFLVLDPHYTGSEDIGTIQNQSKKNSCSGIPSVGWHDISVFRKDSFYNLCLPQRPKTI